LSSSLTAFLIFSNSSKALRAVGYEVVNPAELEGEGILSWEDCLRRDLHEINGCSRDSFKSRCQGIATLKGWKDSRGANLETFNSIELAVPVFTVEHYLKTNSIFNYVLSDKEVV